MRPGWRSVRRGAGRLSFAGVLMVVALSTGCGTDEAGPPKRVTVHELQRESYFYSDDRLGWSVTVKAAVSHVRGPRSFELSGGSFGDKTLPVVTTRPVRLSEGETVRVSGTVGQLHSWNSSEKLPYIQDELYTKPETGAYLFHATVR